MEDTEYEPTRESYLGTIVRLTEELNAVTRERDAALAALKSTHEQLEANGHILDTDTTAAIRMVELEKCITSAKAAAESADVSYRAYLRALDRAEKAEERADLAKAEAREMRDCRQREHDMRVKLAGELESAKDEAREMRTAMLEMERLCMNHHGIDLSCVYDCSKSEAVIKDALDKARAEREEVGHE